MKVFCLIHAFHEQSDLEVHEARSKQAIGGWIATNAGHDCRQYVYLGPGSLSLLLLLKQAD